MQKREESSPKLEGKFVKNGEIKSKMEILVDTGSDISIILETVCPINASFEEENLTVRVANDEKFTFKKSTIIAVKIGNMTKRIKCFVFPKEIGGFPVILGADAMRKLKIGISFEKEKINVKSRNEKERGIRDSEWILEIEENFIPVKKSKITEITLHASKETKIEKNCCAMIKVKTRLKEGTEVEIEKMSLKNGLMIPSSLSKVKEKKILINVLNLSNSSQVIKLNSELTKCEALGGDTQLCAINRTERMAGRKGERKSADKTAAGALQANEIDCGMQEAKNRLTSLLNEYRSIVKKKGEKVELAHAEPMKINTGNATARYKRQYSTPFALKEEMKNVIRKMKEEKVIEESVSPWNSPIFLIKKKNGEFRPVIDYRELNQVTEIERFPLPVMDDLFKSMNKAKIFSTIDLLHAYWQIELESESRKKTSFTCSEGKFQFTRVPFGLCNAPIHFAKVIHGILAELLGVGVLCYLDDIVIFSETMEEHFKILKTVFDKLKQANLQVKLEKSKFFCHEANFLGHKLTRKGVQVDEEKVTGITKMRPPENKKQIMSFLGMTNYYRNFIGDYAVIAKPLTDLLSEKAEWKWSENEDSAFEKLKKKLKEAPILIYPDFEKEFFVFTDASDYAVGSALCQVKNNKFFPIGYQSKKLNGTQQNYSTLKKEALAIKLALAYYRTIIFGHRVTVFTDHRPLISVFGKILPRGAVGRWVLEIMNYRPIVRYVIGRVNVTADALSRVPMDEIMERSEKLKIEQDALEEGVYAVQTLKGEEEEGTVGSIFEREKWREEQKNDRLCKYVVAILKGGSEGSKGGKVRKINLNEYMLSDGLLCKRRILQRVDKEEIALNVVVPERTANEVIAWSHEMTGHAGKERTLHTFRKYFFIENEAKKTEEFLKKCDVCKKANGRPRKAPMNEYPVAKVPWTHVHVDLIGPLTVTEKGNKYILVAVDMATRFCVIEALPTKEAHSVAAALRARVFAIFGSPRVLVSDNGSEFVNEIFANLLDVYKTVHRTTVAYHPSSNGLVERRNGTLGKILRAVLTQEERNSCWDEFLAEVMLIMNTTYTRAIGDTSHYALLGYDPRGPLDELEDIEEAKLWKPKSLRRKQIGVLREKVKCAIEKSTGTTHKWVNQKRKKKEIKVGDRIFTKQNTGRKLAPLCEGPFIVKEVSGRGNLIAEDAVTRKTRRIHEDQVLPTGEAETDVEEEAPKNKQGEEEEKERKSSPYNLRNKKKK